MTSEYISIRCNESYIKYKRSTWNGYKKEKGQELNLLESIPFKGDAVVTKVCPLSHNLMEDSMGFDPMGYYY